MTPHLAVAGSPAGDDVMPALAAFRDASPDLLQARTLLNRVDRKFLLSLDQLAIVLCELAAHYRLLRAAGSLAATYQTQYFDTVDSTLYHDHRRGRFPRFKVRLRDHLERRLSFLEVKSRRYTSGTVKARLPQPFRVECLDDEARRFIGQHCPVAAGELRRRTSNTFRRLTLLSEATPERLTIDWDLAIADERRVESLPGLVILEIKQARYSNTTPAMIALRRLRARERAISKYCLAVARLTPARSNAFRPALRAVEHLLA